jgi:hypothetical protein
MYAEASITFGGSERQWRVPYSNSGEAIEYALMFDGTVPTENGSREATIKIPEGVLADIVKAGDLGDKKYLVVGQKDMEIPGVKRALFYFKESGITQQYNTTELAGLWKEVTYDPEKNEWIDKTDWSRVDESVVKNPSDAIPGKVTESNEIPSSGGLTSEQQTLVEVTAHHLTEVYGDSMDPAIYPDEASKLEFFAKLTEIGLDLNPDNPNLANQIAAAMNLETDKTFSPKIKNPTSGATGLIQFMPDFAPGIVGKTTDELEAMGPIEQLTFVKQYLAHWQGVAEIQGKGKMRTVSDVYWAIFGPAFMGVSTDTIA